MASEQNAGHPVDRYTLGIEIGSGFIHAATSCVDADGRRGTLPLRLTDDGSAAPAVAYVGADGVVVIGAVAQQQGELHPERLVHGFVERIGDAVPIVVGELEVTAEDLLAVTVEWVVARAAAESGGPAERVTIVHPATWSDYRVTQVREAVVERGLRAPQLISAPVAAALGGRWDERVEQSPLLVVDLGARFASAAVLRKDDAGGLVVAGIPERVGDVAGAAFDQAVLEHLGAQPEDAGREVNAGAQAPSETGLPYRNDDTPGHRLSADPAALRRRSITAKEALSTATEIAVLLGDTPAASVRIVRGEFEDLIAPALRTALSGVERTLHSAGLETTDLAAVLLVGGSARIPLVAELLAEETGLPVTVPERPELAAAEGAALGIQQFIGSAGTALAQVPSSADIVLFGAPRGDEATPSRSLDRRAPAAPVAPIAVPTAWHRRHPVRAGLLAAAAAAAITALGLATPLGAGVRNLVADGVDAVESVLEPGPAQAADEAAVQEATGGDSDATAAGEGQNSLGQASSADGDSSAGAGQRAGSSPQAATSSPAGAAAAATPSAALVGLQPTTSAAATPLPTAIATPSQVATAVPTATAAPQPTPEPTSYTELPPWLGSGGATTAPEPSAEDPAPSDPAEADPAEADPAPSDPPAGEGEPVA